MKLYGLGDNTYRSWFISRCVHCTEKESIMELDFYIRQCVRHRITGSYNYTHNLNKVPDTDLVEYGYMSMIYMYNCYRYNRSLYYMAVERMKKCII